MARSPLSEAEHVLFLVRVEQHLRSRLACSIKARSGAVAFVHRLGSALNEDTHFHVVVIEPDPERGDGVFRHIVARRP